MTDSTQSMSLPLLGDGPTYERQQIWLPQLIAQTIRAGRGVIEDRTFIDCRLEGPAVVMPVGACEFDACDMGYSGGDIRNLLLAPVGAEKVIGAIAFRNCTFRRCAFFAVGFTGAPEFLRNFHAVVGGEAS
ncbi:MAG: hypothetical protein K0M78_11170 [Brevundimonas sp.]|nr:hypothetical protein [Brevundimonas sp.]